MKVDYVTLETAWNEVIKGEYGPEVTYSLENDKWYFADTPLFYQGKWWSIHRANELLRWGSFEFTEEAEPSPSEQQSSS